jgi:hypothetical protein
MLMVIANLIGGLGNQMFQYACGRSLALATDAELRFRVDQFEGYKLHQGLELPRVFDLHLPLANATDLRRCIGAWRSPIAMRRLLAWPAWPLPTGRPFIAEPKTQPGDKLVHRAMQGAYLHGYWQSETWFARHADALRADLTWRFPLRGRNLETADDIHASSQAISVHIRRGDYLSSAKSQGIYATCTPAYYEAAIKRLRDRGGGRVFAFSDDPVWVQEVLAPKVGNLVLVDHNRGADSHFDMRLMSLCRHHVIANSSFSWWGAWLNVRPDKQVIGPANWFVNGADSQHLMPATWERM